MTQPARDLAKQTQDKQISKTKALNLGSQSIMPCRLSEASIKVAQGDDSSRLDCPWAFLAGRAAVDCLLHGFFRKLMKKSICLR